MNVMLVRPHAPNKLSLAGIINSEPLELEYLYTALKSAGIKSFIYDGAAAKKSFKETVAACAPDIVAFTGYITQQNIIKNHARVAKRINPRIIVAAGGVHAQLNPHNFYHDNIDFVCTSADPDDFVLLLKNLCSAEFANINGLHYKRNGAYIKNDLRPVDINNLPIPDRSFFDANKTRFHFLDLAEPASLKTALSCTHKCNFCYCTLLNKGHFSRRSLDKIFEEIKTINTQNIQILDDNFLTTPGFALEFIEGVKKHNINKTFICYARADFTARNPDIIKQLAGAGFKYFIVGIETLDDSMLKAYNKETSADINSECVKNIHLAGADIIALLMVDNNAAKSDFEKIYRWSRDNNLRYVTVSIFTPMEGTSLYDKYKDSLTTRDAEKWDFLHLVLPARTGRLKFYLYFYALTVKLFLLGKKRGAYGFVSFSFFMNIFFNFIRRKTRGL